MLSNIAVKQLFQQAMTARRLAPNAKPPLKPDHPNQRRTVPRVAIDTLCGRKLIIILCCRFPRAMLYAKAETREQISTGSPRRYQTRVLGSVWQRGGTQTSSIIQNPILKRSPINIPNPTCNRTIYQRRLKKHKNHHRHQPPPLRHRFSHNRCCRSTELHLGNTIQQLRHQRTPGLGSPSVFVRPKCARLPMKPEVLVEEKARE